VEINLRRVALVLTSILITFIALRAYLHLFPGTNLDVGDYNIHHLFTGLLLIMLAGLPLIFFSGNSRLLDFLSLLFGAGLSMAMDEWIYLIATDGSDSAYLLPVSIYGAVIMIALMVIYILLLWFSHKFRRNSELQTNKVKDSSVTPN